MWFSYVVVKQVFSLKYHIYYRLVSKSYHMEPSPKIYRNDCYHTYWMISNSCYIDINIILDDMSLWHPVIDFSANHHFYNSDLLSYTIIMVSSRQKLLSYLTIRSSATYFIYLFVWNIISILVFIRYWRNYNSDWIIHRIYYSKYLF